MSEEQGQKQSEVFDKIGDINSNMKEQERLISMIKEKFGSALYNSDEPMSGLPEADESSDLPVLLKDLVEINNRIDSHNKELSKIMEKSVL